MLLELDELDIEIKEILSGVKQNSFIIRPGDTLPLIMVWRK
ncbi:MAG: hypothetical protein PHP26_04285 [Syntrophomonas sp.]|nr:hypothetical protein [Syntrophomonas sp.]